MTSRLCYRLLVCLTLFAWVFCIIPNFAIERGIILAADQSARVEYPTGDYYPLTPGFWWEYAVNERGSKETFLMKVYVEEPPEDFPLDRHILTQVDRRGRMRSFLVSTEQGIFCEKTGLNKNIGVLSPPVYAVHQPPIPVFPMGPDASHIAWKGTLRVGFINKRVTLTGGFMGSERVRVPAGTFECVKFVFYQTRNGAQSTEYAWYAQGVGQVRYEGSQYIKELVRFAK